MTCAYKILITKPKGRRLGMPRHTWDKHTHAHMHAHTRRHVQAHLCDGF